MATYHESLQAIAKEYSDSTGHDSYTTRDLAVWAIHSGKWDAPPDLLIQKCQEDFSSALRDEYITDLRGRPVRSKHAARMRANGRQGTFWADIRTASRKHMEVAFQQRREQVVGDCRQLKRDVDFFNSTHPNDDPIQTVFNFEDDIEEGEYSEGCVGAT